MDNRKLNVNILIPGLTGGGAERVVSELSLNHPDDVNLCISTYSLKNKVYQTGDALLYTYDENSSINILSKFLFRIKPLSIYMVYLHYLYMKRNKFDVSISFLTHSNVLNMLISYLFQIPTVVSIRNNVLEEHGFGFFPTLQKYLLRISSPYLIVNSEENKNWLVNHYHLDADKCVCIYNPKDISLIRSLSIIPVEEDFFNTDEFILLTVGRLAPQKGHIHLLRIFRHLCEVVPCRLVICGIGPLESSLKVTAMKLGILNSVYFAGFCDNPYKYMKRADIFVFPSLYEGQPNALIEALVCGCPIVSSDCDYGPREILEDGKYGLLSQKLDGKIGNPIEMPLTEAEQDMCDKILYLMQNPDIRLNYSNLSRNYVTKFDNNIIVDKYFDVFRGAASNSQK